MPIQLREHEIADVMTRFKAYRKRYGIMEACQKVTDDTGIPKDTVYMVQYRMRPTTEVAADYIRAQSLRLAMRVVRKANVDQAMAILSRPNVGVLDSPTESSGGGGRMFQIGVQLDSLGSVKVGVQIGDSQPRAISGETVGSVHAEGPEAGRYLQSESLGDVLPAESVGGEVPGNDRDGGHPPVPKRWYRKDPPKQKLAPAPLAEGRSERGPGASLEFRLAQAKRERKEAAADRRKARETVSKRAAELREELRKAREKAEADEAGV